MDALPYWRAFPRMLPPLSQNVAAIRQRIADAARKAGRDPAEICLVGVTKYVDAETARRLAAAGVADLGESRPQQLWAKAEALRDENVRWHLIGALQRNKVRRTLESASLIHSLDSPRLADAIDQEAKSLGRRVDVLLEINISGDATKHGAAPEVAAALLDHAGRLPQVRIRGLMAMSHREGGPDVARRDFAQLRELRDRLRRAAPAAADLRELSMGMSDDFEQAIMEGATIVRIGSALFEETTS